MFKIKYLHLLLMGCGGLHGALAHAQTETYPNKPVRVVVPFAPGGSLDIITRLIAPKMSEFLA